MGNMLCPKCKKQNPGDSLFCVECGNVLQKNDKDSNSTVKKRSNSVLRTVILILGIIVLIGTSNAAGQIYNGGESMISLHSQAGNTVAEAYYQSMGQALTGMSYAVRALGLGVLIIALGLYGKLASK